MIDAILRAQWWSLRPGRSRGAVFGVITAFVWYGFWCSVSYSVWALARAADAGRLAPGVPAGLLLVCVYWQVVPVVSGSLGSALDMRKLLLYPAPHGKLFLVEVLLRFTTGAEMMLVLAGGLAGLAVNPEAGGLAALPRMLGAILIFVLFNLLLASGLRSLLERLLSRRHVREALIFLVLGGLTVPRILIASGLRPGSMDGLLAFLAPPLPWTAAGNLVLGRALAGSFALLCGWTAAAAWFGRSQFERNLRYDAMAAQATPLRPGVPAGQPWSEQFYRLPARFLRDPLAALVEKELRSLARTPRFRMVFVMGFSFGLMVWLPFILGGRAQRQGALGENFLVVVCVYALTLMGQVTYWNSFGFDRAAVQIYFAAPQPIVLTLFAKNLASLLFIYLEVFILTGLTLLLRVGIGPAKVVEALLVVGVCALYMLALGNVSSVQYPRALKPERVSQGGASSRFQGLIFILYPIALLPVFLAYLARYAFESQTAFAVILAFAAVLGGVLYWIATESAVNGVSKNRERILRELSGDEGPIASG